MQTTFDYIVVGAGTAGCLLANRLSADPTNSVLLLEAGKSDNYHWVHIPVGYLYCIGNPRTDWMFNTAAEAGLNGRSLRYPRGKVLGGCSSINGMIYMRGQARDYDGWATATGEDEWRWDNVLPDFIAHENHHKLDSGDPVTGHNARFSDHHGNDGELRIEAQRLRWDLLDSFSDAMQQTGVPATDDFNTGNNHGVGYFDVTQRKGWRWNAAKAFLRTIKNRTNLVIWTQAQVDQLTFDQANGLRCTGANIRRKDQHLTITARKEVILSAGAIGSPQILQRSGIGCAMHLRSLGITPVLDQPAVGANLQDHLQLRTVYKVANAKTLNTLASTLFGKAKIGLEYIIKRSGPMSMSPSQLGAFTHSDPDQPHPNLQYHVQPLSLDAFGEALHPYPAMTVSVCNLNPTSRGHIKIISADMDAHPDIAPHYLTTNQDRHVAVDSLRQVRKMMSQPAMAQYEPDEVKPGTQYQTDDDLVKAAGDISSTIFHPIGTVKMGDDGDKTAVLDPQLRLRGVAGLRVADASAMPSITSGNTNAPTLLIAEKAAKWILAQN